MVLAQDPSWKALLCELGYKDLVEEPTDKKDDDEEDDDKKAK